MLNLWVLLGVFVLITTVHGFEATSEGTPTSEGTTTVTEPPGPDFSKIKFDELFEFTKNLTRDIATTRVSLKNSDESPFLGSYDSIIILNRDLANNAAAVTQGQIDLADIKEKLTESNLAKFNENTDYKKFLETSKLLLAEVQAIKEFYDEALEQIKKNIDGDIPQDGNLNVLWSLIPGYEQLLTESSFNDSFIEGCKNLSAYFGEVTDDHLPSLVNFNISKDIYDDGTFGVYALLFGKALTVYELIYPICAQKNNTERVDDYPIVLSIFDMIMGTDNDVNRRNAARGEQIFKGQVVKTKVSEAVDKCKDCNEQSLAEAVYDTVLKNFGHLKHPETLRVYQFLVTLGWDFEVYYRAGDLFNYTNFEEPKVGNLLGQAIPQSVPKCKFSKPMSKSIPDNFKKEFCEAHKDAEQGVYKFLVDKCIRFNLALLRLIKSDKGIIPVLSGHDDFDIWKYDLDCSAEGGEKSTRGILVMI